jgi:GAF domain-containing protein
MGCRAKRQNVYDSRYRGRKMEENQELAEQIRSLAEGERAALPLLANAAAVIYWGMKEVSWAGFYLLQGEELVLGPFQGKPACIRIPLGKGVCGTAASRKRTLVVPDVSAFPGHIACDSASRSEIVVPLIHDGRVLGVLDLDSTVPGRFGEREQRALEAVSSVLSGMPEKLL